MAHITRFSAVCLASCLFLPSSPAAGQGDTMPVVIEGGVGVGLTDEGAGPAFYAGAALGPWKVRWSRVAELDVGIASDSDPETGWDVGALRLWRLSLPWGFASLGAGVGVAGGRDHERAIGGEDPEWTTVGVPLEASVHLASTRVGIGVTLFGDLNAEGVFGGAALTLVAGRLPGG